MTDEDIPEALLQRLGTSDGRRLFVPSHFDFADHAGLLAFIEQNPLAQVIAIHDGEIRISATPLIYDQPLEADADGAQHQFIGHLARRNPQTDGLHGGMDGVALVAGPDAYISPRWNREGPGLPTWSYISAQLRGRFEAITDEAGMRNILERTIACMEQNADRPWRLDDAPAELVDKLIQHIVGFRFRVWDMQGISRLNQNRKMVDRLGIVEGLRTEGDADATAIAALMQADIDKHN